MSNRKCPVQFSGRRISAGPWPKSQNDDSAHPSRMCRSPNVNPKRAEKFKVQSEITFLMEIFSCVVAMMPYFLKYFCVSSGYFLALKDQQIIII